MRNFQITLSVILAISATACVNGGAKAVKSAASVTSPFGSTSTTSSGPVFTVAGSSVQANGSGGTGCSASLHLDFTSGATPFTQVCTLSNCYLRLDWTDTNGNANNYIKHGLTSVASFSMDACLSSSVPSDMTPIHVSILPESGGSQFSVNPYTFTAGQGAAQADFWDQSGVGFADIMRYSCFDLFTRGLKIQNAHLLVPGGLDLLSATGLVYRTHDGTVRAPTYQQQFGTLINNPDAVGYSSQSYYYSLYMRVREIGKINGNNSGFTCPVSTAGAFNDYQHDTTFALSLSQTGNYTVPVESASQLTGGSDPLSAPSKCSGGTGATGGLINTSCLGFAIRPNDDGTCPLLKDKVGANLPTYRLRRYFALYPVRYNTDGRLIENNIQPTDTTYVLDRPVGPVNLDGSGNLVVAATMQGPKPCPFAQFDNKVTSAGIQEYLGTNNTLWNGHNIDGLQFPNQDVQDQVNNNYSCSAALPLQGPNSNGVAFTVGTVNKNSRNAAMKEVAVRPQNSWSSFYEEDTDFIACAPAASKTNYSEPPIHTASTADGSNQAWCAEIYPTHNTVGSGTTQFVGDTTHSGGSPVTESGTLTWHSPLLAGAADVTSALLNNPSYSCAISYDTHATKKIGTIPTSGCCTNRVPAGQQLHLTGNVSANNYLQGVIPQVDNCGVPSY